MRETNTSQCLRLYLIRHGEVENAAAGKLLGFTDPALSDHGLKRRARWRKIWSPHNYQPFIQVTCCARDRQPTQSPNAVA